MDSVLEDKRFEHVRTDMRFRSVPRRERRVKIDQRFKSMFTDRSFKVKYTVDKRGRPQDLSSSEHLKKYYDLSSDDEDQSHEDEQTEEEEETQVPSKFTTQVPDKGVKQIPERNLKDCELQKSSADLHVSRKLAVKLDRKLDSPENDLGSSESEDESEEEEGIHPPDRARGEGNLETSSSSDDSSSDTDSEELIHPWNELDKEAIATDQSSKRLAVCNMDWDRINAQDLFVLLNSFTPPGGLLHSVKIYLSDYGRERLSEEEVMGPRELTETKLDPEEDEDEVTENQEIEGDKYHMEKLRQYQLNKLKYYYAVVECDNEVTANKIYEECDGMEYESSAAKLDLRIIPPDVTFDEEPHSVATNAMDLSHYRPKYFITTALQQAKVRLTWDETNPERATELQKAFEKGDELNMDMKAYLASSSEDDDEPETKTELLSKKRAECGSNDDTDSNEDDEGDAISKYKALLRDIEAEEGKKKKDDVHLEITWGTGLKEKTESIVQNKMLKKELTPWQEYLMQKKEKKQQKREETKKQIPVTSDESRNLYSDDELPSDVDINDAFFDEENLDDAKSVPVSKFGQDRRKKKKVNVGDRSAKKDDDAQDDTKQKAELELLLMEDSTSKRHFNLKKLLKEKKKAKQQKPENAANDFHLNVEDPRFSAIFDSHIYNIDPSDPNFKRTKGMEALIQEKQKRQLKQAGSDTKKPKLAAAAINHDSSSSNRNSSALNSLELSSLVKSVKSKMTNFKQNKSK